MSAPPERVVLFGSEGGFSLPVLQQLLSAGVTVAGLVVPGRAATDPARRDLPVAVEQAHPSTLTGLAVTHAVPVLRAGEHSAGQLAGELSGLGAEVLLVACYPLAIPAAVWQRPEPACWNLHPSLLPKYRGPTPLYWQLRLHERKTGITLHEVSGRLDAGAIVAQSCHALPADASAAALDEWVARHGVALFLDALAAHRRGRLRPVPQDEAAASYYPDPARAGSTRH